MGLFSLKQAQKPQKTDIDYPSIIQIELNSDNKKLNEFLLSKNALKKYNNLIK